MMRRILRIQLGLILALGAIVLLLWAAGKILSFGRPQAPSSTTSTPPTKSLIVNSQTSMRLTSLAFQHNQPIPSLYTCDGQDINPPLAISEVPEGTKSLALIVDDPDAPMGTWVHWTMWNIDPKTTEIKEGSVPVGVVQGITTSKQNSYGGPCPPSGVHRYFFKLYALDAMLNVLPNSDKKALEQAMQGHVLAMAELMGTYQRK